MVKLVHDIERLEAPYTKFFSNFQDILDYVLSGDEAALVGRPREGWVMLHGLHPVTCRLQSSVEYPIVEYALQKLATKAKTEDGCTTLSYTTKSLVGVFNVFKNCLMAAFLGVPVALQALDVTTTGATVGIYLAALLVFGILVQFLMEDHTVQTLLTMAYAAVLVANMSPK
ncbi:hypothetical protein FSARC_2396 [Fusarium sarcochroum]|uniref:Uncharacterized protein n=1 Tax=Fusarium sarcochroum TaxID=1208366 RepID=A0A8H4U6T9_9HYPO|nr:hypothetical protein FSARC_2396 [Fusarium sarcochroum]